MEYMHKQQDIKRQLIKEVQELARKLGRTPKKREFKKYSSATHHFGSWNNFIKEAGLLPLKEVNMSLEEYENAIHKFVEKHGRVPTQKDFYNNIYLPDPRTIERKFNKTWNEILKSLGYKPSIRMNDFSQLTDKEIINIVDKEIKRIGSTTMRNYEEKRNEDAPSVRFLKDRLGLTWNSILQILGYQKNKIFRSKEELINILRYIANDLDRTPSINDLKKYNISDSPFKDAFGSYNNAIKEAGLKPNVVLAEVLETNEELLQMYIELCAKLGRAATGSEIDMYLKYKSDVFAIRFGGLNNLRVLAGYDPYYVKKKYTKDEIKKKLITEYKKYNRRLTNNELKELSKVDDNFPTVTTILRYFQTTKISEVWKEIEKELKG